MTLSARILIIIVIVGGFAACSVNAEKPADSRPSENAGPRSNTRIESWETAHTKLREIYPNGGFTFYCGRRWNSHMEIEPEAGSSDDRKAICAGRVKWSRVVALHEFKPSFREWRKTHKECFNSKEIAANCMNQLNHEYRFMENDLYNRVPAADTIAKRRPEFRFGILPDGAVNEICGVHFGKNIMTPPENVRGDIARIYFYMENAYPGRLILDKKDRRMFGRWDAADPVDAVECARAGKIESVQKSVNEFVKNACLKSGFW